MGGKEPAAEFDVPPKVLETMLAIADVTHHFLEDRYGDSVPSNGTNLNTALPVSNSISLE